MIFNNILSKLYPKIYISIVVSVLETCVCVEICSSKKILKTDVKVFNGSKVTDNMITFISEYKKESPFFYISLLDYSDNQGAIDGCIVKEEERDTVEMVCHGSWSSFTSKASIKQMQHFCLPLELDFIFSPFTILWNIFSQKMDEDRSKLFVLFSEDIAVISIFHNNMLRYADVVDMKIAIETNLDDEVEIESLEDDSIDFEDINLEGLDVEENIDDLSNLQELDDSESFDDLDDFADTAKNIKEAIKEEVQEVDISTQNYKQFLIIQNALHHFYTDHEYKSEFIEVAFIAVQHLNYLQLQQYIEEELFLKVHIRKIDLCRELISLAKKENM